MRVKIIHTRDGEEGICDFAQVQRIKARASTLGTPNLNPYSIFTLDIIVLRLSNSPKAVGSVRLENKLYLDDDLVIDLHFNELTRHGLTISLSATQSRIIERLSQNLGAPVAHREIIQYAWGRPNAITEKQLYVYMNRIRSKLHVERNRADKYLISVHGFGYMLYSSASQAVKTHGNK